MRDILKGGGEQERAGKVSQRDGKHTAEIEFKLLTKKEPSAGSS
jgi:hypothetical protein